MQKETNVEITDDASSASSPNEERVDKLKEEIRLLKEMLKLAQEYISILSKGCSSASKL